MILANELPNMDGYMALSIIGLIIALAIMVYMIYTITKIKMNTDVIAEHEVRTNKLLTQILDAVKPQKEQEEKKTSIPNNPPKQAPTPTNAEKSKTINTQNQKKDVQSDVVKMYLRIKEAEEKEKNKN